VDPLLNGEAGTPLPTDGTHVDSHVIHLTNYTDGPFRLSRIRHWQPRCSLRSYRVTVPIYLERVVESRGALGPRIGGRLLEAIEPLAPPAVRSHGCVRYPHHVRRHRLSRPRLRSLHRRIAPLVRHRAARAVAFFRPFRDTYGSRRNPSGRCAPRAAHAPCLQNSRRGCFHTCHGSGLRLP